MHEVWNCTFIPTHNCNQITIIVPIKVILKERREHHLNVLLLWIRVSLISAELPGYIFIQSTIRWEEKKVLKCPGSAWLSSHLSEGDCLVDKWRVGPTNTLKFEEEEKLFLSILTYKSQDTGASHLD